MGKAGSGKAGAMLKQMGEVLVLEDGTEAKVTPLREDRGALASLALFAVIAVLSIVGSIWA